MKDLTGLSVLLFLDDERAPIDCATYMYRRAVDCRVYHKEWHIVRSHGQFINWIEENGLPEFISFDYDLTDNFELKATLPVEEWFDFVNNKDYKGIDCAKWLLKYCSDNNNPLPAFAVHSANHYGTIEINELIKKHHNGKERDIENS